MTDANLWNQLLIWPITNILILYYKLFELVKLPGALGWAVILLTATIRLILYPLMKAQLVSAKKMSNLKPHLDELSKKHKDDKQALQQAQLALYKEHGVNPAAGCVPLLVQMPVLIALYNVFFQVLGNGNAAEMVEKINTIVYTPWMKIGSLDLTFFGTNLGLKPSGWQTQGWWLLAVPVITAGLQWYQTKLMMPKEVKSQNLKVKSKEDKLKKEDKKDETDQAAEMQKQMALISPVMFGVFAFQMPLGLSLYWNVFGLFGIMQQLAVNREHERTVKI
jgi:YidC/Oxa1 family membrane protein insertase